MKDTLRIFDAGKGKTGYYYSLPALQEKGLGKISRLPVSIRIVLESVLRNCDGKKVAEKDVETLAAWNAKAPAQEEIPFVVARIVLQDFTGVPLLVDLAAMRTAVAKLKIPRSSSHWCRWIWWSITRCRWTSSVRPMRCA
jgi:aconitate hydratase